MAAAVTPEQLVGRLKGLSLTFKEFQHEALLTCEDFAKVTEMPDSVSVVKNILLKDKKHRLVLISALSSTKVDMKVLSSRLGLGKGGIRMAPDELLGQVLQVALGSVTPFALVQETAADVVFLMDEKLKSATELGLHPLTNTQTVAVAPAGLEAFLTSIGRPITYVDLEAEPVINADNPPDLKHLLDSAKPYANAAIDTAPPQGGGAGEGAGKKDKKDKKGAKAAAVKQPTASAKDYSNVDQFVKDCLEMLPGAAELSEAARRSLEADLSVKLLALKNASYTAGFVAARGAMADACNTTIK